MAEHEHEAEPDSPSSMDQELAKETGKMTVLEIKDEYTYVIPSFSVISMNLRRARVRFFRFNEVHTMDVFFRVGDNLPGFTAVLPSKVNVNQGVAISAEEFSRGISTDTLDINEETIFVAYDWKWDDGLNQDPDNEAIDCSVASEPNEPDEDLPEQAESSEPITDITAPRMHKVTFKCIGATRDDGHQLALRTAKELISSGHTVPVKLSPEPTNPFDAKAIAFTCCIDGQWKRIGYVVREVLDEVHAAMRSGNIVEVRFAWVKFLLSHPRSGYGMYAGIDITCHGEWSQTVLSSASTM